jgi:hypothetical protein
MRSLRYSISLVVLSIASSLALSDHANAVLDDLSALQKSLQSNQDTIERYNGGLAAATPLLTGFYKTWSSLRTANAHIPRDARFTSDDSDAIYESLNSSNDMSIELFHAYEKKMLSPSTAASGLIWSSF